MDKSLGSIYTIGAISSSLPFYLNSYAEVFIPSSLAAITNASAPIFTAVLAHYTFDCERLSMRKIIGLALGAFGICVVFLPPLLLSSDHNEFGIVVILLASACYGVGIVYTKKYLKELPSLVIPCWQTLAGALWIIPFSLLFDHPFSLAMPSFSAWGEQLGWAFSELPALSFFTMKSLS